MLRGTPVVPGVGSGPIVRPMPQPVIPVDDPAVDPAVGAERFSRAAEAVAARLSERAKLSSGAAAEVLVATANLARDRGLVALVQKRLSEGNGLSHATAGAISDLAAMFTAAGGVMAERVTDLNDVRNRLIAQLTGQPEPGIPVPTVPSVLCAEDLAPADTATLNSDTYVAIATVLGGPTSHTSIISRQLGIPCVVAAEGLDALSSGTPVLVDGSTGEIIVDPDPQLVTERTEKAAEIGRAAAQWRGPGTTSDGHRVQILVNVQDGATARAAAPGPVEGVGLFRTELCFLDRDTEPSVEEQAAIYREVIEAMGDRKVVIRTLDAGSDKPVAFATIADEPNPALGVRGMRIGQRQESLMDHQLDAIAKAAEGLPADVWVMAPMIATEDEAQWFAEKVHARGLKAGVMIEVPSAALLAERVLRHVDFCSIGSNDLSQYTFAADRMAPSLSNLTDPWQPALLKLIGIVADAGSQVAKPVGVCGEAAADAVLGCVLVGLGVTSLSAAASATPLVGSKLAGVTLDQCRAAAAAAVAARDPQAARSAAAAALG